VRGHPTWFGQLCDCCCCSLVDFLRQEREDAERQLQNSKLDYEKKMKEMETSMEKPPIPQEEESGSYTPRQLNLISRVLIKWRNHRFTSLKDELLSTAVLLKVFFVCFPPFFSSFSELS